MSIGSTMVSWYSRKQIYVLFISEKEEYMVAIQGSCEAIWMRKILVGLFGQMMDPNMIYFNN